MGKVHALRALAVMALVSSCVVDDREVLEHRRAIVVQPDGRQVAAIAAVSLDADPDASEELVFDVEVAEIESTDPDAPELALVDGGAADPEANAGLCPPTHDYAWLIGCGCTTAGPCEKNSSCFYCYDCGPVVCCY